VIVRFVAVVNVLRPLFKIQMVFGETQMTQVLRSFGGREGIPTIIFSSSYFEALMAV
jgi:hypothetical protein